jgi:hypothetical protein
VVSGIWYHGSQQAFDQFSLPRSYSPKMQLGFGIHFATNKVFARLYGNVIYACHLHPRRVFNAIGGLVRQPGSEKDLMAKDFLRGTGRKPYFIEKGAYVFPNPDIKSPQKAESIFRKYGYDAVLYEARYGGSIFQNRQNVSHKTKALVILDPSVIEIIRKEVTEKVRRK